MNDDAQVPRRRLSVLLLLAAGGIAAVAGVVWVLIAKASLDDAARAASTIPTLPVFTYTQYTQHAVTPDYTGVVLGAIVFVLGVALLLAGALGSARRARAA
jgi:hypothetical protein